MGGGRGSAVFWTLSNLVVFFFDGSPKKLVLARIDNFIRICIGMLSMLRENWYRYVYVMFYIELVSVM